MESLRKSLKKYYQKDLNALYKFLIPNHSTHLKIKSDNFYKNEKIKKYDYLVVDNCIADSQDIQSLFINSRKYVKDNGRIIISHYNFIWEPILKIGSYLGLRKKTESQNWLDNEDISNLLNLAGFDVITRQKRLLLPMNIPVITKLVNKFVANIPLINDLCLTIYVIARPRIDTKKEYSVSIVVPARNEAGNIPSIVKSIPKFGTKQEIVFVEGNSTDDTWNAIQKELHKKIRKGLSIRAFKQPGKGKSDAVKMGFKHSLGEILMIYDADMTVAAKDLIKFYDALAYNKGDFANGTRLVYPMEKQAMQTLNKIFNKLFSLIFTWILGQRFRDTLCGTKVFFKKDYENFMSFKKDPFGDFELIFGAIKNNSKIIEIPVRYKERIYGSTNISRFKNGIQLMKMTWVGFVTFKAK